MCVHSHVICMPTTCMHIERKERKEGRKERKKERIVNGGQGEKQEQVAEGMSEEDQSADASQNQRNKAGFLTPL